MEVLLLDFVAVTLKAPDANSRIKPLGVRLLGAKGFLSIIMGV
jgi:hypothetical protein